MAEEGEEFEVQKSHVARKAPPDQYVNLYSLGSQRVRFSLPLGQEHCIWVFTKMYIIYLCNVIYI